MSESSAELNTESNLLPVNLSLLLDELRLAQEDETQYVHRVTGKLQLISEEEIAIMGEVHDDMLPEIEVEIIDDIREALVSDDWIELPSSLPEEPLLGEFAKEIADEALRTNLQTLLKTSYGMSQRVLDFLYEQDLEDAWAKFQRQALEKAIATQLKKHNIPFV